MGQVLEVIGWLVILIAGLAMLAVGLQARGTTEVVAAIVFPAPVAFAGLLMVVFGGMLTQLVEIRKSNAKLEALFGEVVAGMKRRASGPEQ